MHSASLVIRRFKLELQCDTYYPQECLKLKMTENSKSWEGSQAIGMVMHCWWEYIIPATLDISLAAPTKGEYMHTP